MRAIITNALSKHYKDVVAVRSLDLEVQEGEVFGLLGTNGAGKTTTVKMLSTLIEPSGGEIRIFGMDSVKERSSIRETVNISPQETAIAPNLTVRENLLFMAGVYGVKDAKARIDELAQALALGKVMSRRAKTLSGGWQRKLSIALALINRPRLLFLDEPTLGLDVIARRELWSVIRSLRTSTTVILTTHYMEEAENLCDRVAIMSRGDIVACDTPDGIIRMTGKEKFEDAFAYLVTGGKL